MTIPPLPRYSFSDALHRLRMNLMNYKECFDESTENYQQNDKLLKIIDDACSTKAAQKLVAIVFMSCSEDNFFIENAPKGDPSKWVGNYVHDIADVEYVEVFTKGNHHINWSNPNSSPESDDF